MKRPSIKRTAILWLGVLALLVGVNLTVWRYERVRSEGDVVLLALAPVDPRSLLQGDYMVVSFYLSEAIRERLDQQRDAAMAARRGADPDSAPLEPMQAVPAPQAEAPLVATEPPPAIEPVAPPAAVAPPVETTPAPTVTPPPEATAPAPSIEAPSEAETEAAVTPDPDTDLPGNRLEPRGVLPDGVDIPPAGFLIVKLDARGVGQPVRAQAEAQPRAEGEYALPYRADGDRVELVTGTFFFAEGRGAHFARARFGEIRVDARGHAVLTGLRDRDRKPL